MNPELTWETFLATASAPSANVLVRLIVGAGFLTEGIQKFLHPAAPGVGRFAKIGIPWPEFSAPFDAVFEVGRFTRLAGGRWLLATQATV